MSYYDPRAGYVHPHVTAQQAAGYAAQHAYPGAAQAQRQGAAVPLLGLAEYHVNWPSFLARAGIRALFLWPVIRFIGGGSTGRSVAAGVVAGAGLTAFELAFDAAGVLALRKAEDAIDLGAPPPPVIDVTGHSYSDRG